MVFNNSSIMFFDLGPVPPETPVQVSVISKHAQEVIVYWLVPVVTYTPETYIVSIGTSHEILRPTSSIDGNKDIKLKNQIYSVQLTNLHENTIYYYRILARNKYTSTSTKVQTFTTPSSCKCVLTLLVIFISILLSS